MIAQDETCALTILGDVFLDRAPASGNLWAALNGWSQPEDVVVCTYEAPITDLPPTGDDARVQIVSPPHVIDFLRGTVAGVTLAQNHLLDAGVQGARDAASYLTSAGIEHCGYGQNREDAFRPMRLNVGHGITIAIIGVACAFPPHYRATDVDPGIAAVRVLCEWRETPLSAEHPGWAPG